MRQNHRKTGKKDRHRNTREWQRKGHGHRQWHRDREKNRETSTETETQTELHRNRATVGQNHRKTGKKDRHRNTREWQRKGHGNRQWH